MARFIARNNKNPFTAEDEIEVPCYASVFCFSCASFIAIRGELALRAQTAPLGGSSAPAKRRKHRN